MKIAVVGCGALGSYYGAKLCRDGQEVHFLLRSDYDAVRRLGVTVESNEGTFNIRPRCARSPEEIGRCDLVLIGLKTTANDQFPRLLPALADSRTALITLQNGLGNEEAMAALFVPEQILGGLCFVCLNRTAPGVVRHIDHGRIVLGEFQRHPEPRTHDIASLLRHAGVPCQVTDHLAQAHWEKLAWNIPFNGLGVAGAAGLDAVRNGLRRPGAPLGPCLATDALLGDRDWEAQVRELMMEVVRAAQALGFAVPESLVDRQIERTRTMGPYRASTLIDYERGHPLELRALFQEPLRRAEAAGLAMPRLRALCRLLQQLAGPDAGTDEALRAAPGEKSRPSPEP